ncbi:MAG: hypothetical protein ACLUIQ_04495 [Dialister invisus]
MEDYCIPLQLESPGKLISSSYSRGDILVLYQAIKVGIQPIWARLLDAAITVVEAVCFLATPLFLFLP